jgi:cyanate permease
MGAGLSRTICRWRRCLPAGNHHVQLRTRTAVGAAALGGFAIGVGYLFGTIGPLMGGTLFSATGDWRAALLPTP